MNVLITGCAGFIGSHVVEEFIKDSTYTVLGYDKLTYAGNLKNLDMTKWHSNFKFVKGDICNFVKLSKVCKENNRS